MEENMSLCLKVRPFSAAYRSGMGLGAALLAPLLVGGTAFAAPVTSPDFPGVTCETIMIPVRDGTLLATDKYTPAAASGRYPVIMMRNPYGRALGSGCFNGLGAPLATFAQNGYVGLAQEVRGTNRSQGSFNIMLQEAQDGYDAIEWAAVQPWSTGKVGTTSGSYLGLTQWQPAINTPPHLAAIAPQITASDYHDNWTYVGAVFDLWFGLSWPASTFVVDQIIRADQAQGVPQAQIDQQVSQFNAAVNAELATKWVWQLPLTSFDQGFRTYFPHYYDWLAHPSYDAYWHRLDVEPRWQDVKVPALINSAWYDIFQVGAFRNFAGMRSKAGTHEAREGTRLIVGAYGHAGDSGSPTFGDDGGYGSLVPVQAQLPFFDHYLKGLDNGFENSPTVQLYILNPPDTGKTGTAFWITGDDYPLPGTKFEKLYLHSNGHANTRLGDGTLAIAKHAHDAYDNDHDNQRGSWRRRSHEAMFDKFIYDPRNPVPTTGGNMCCNAVLLADGAQDQSSVELRDDVLVYTSAPLREDLAVIGPVKVKLWAKSSARDTDFTAKLVDVHLDGVTHNVLDRIVRARYRDGSKSDPSLIRPGKAYEYEIELGNAGTIFKTGHQIRLEISSSNFPHYARNLNTGLSNESTSTIEIATQTILHGEEYPSHLVLPIAPVTVP
jgi:uncharacterized protein